MGNVLVTGGAGYNGSSVAGSVFSKEEYARLTFEFDLRPKAVLWETGK